MLLAPAAGAATTPKVVAAAVVSVGATPSPMASGGGKITVKGAVKQATSCQLVLLSKATLSLVYSKGPSTTCHGGQFVAHIVVGANSAPAAVHIMFKLIARNAASSASRDFKVYVAGQPAATTTTTAPTTTTLPTTTTTVPGPKGLAPLSPAVSVNGVTSYNWAGYTLGGGPFTAAAGTFTVPSLGASASCTEFMNEWVGVDGVTSSGVIRAGVTVSEQGAGTGSCTPGHESITPFYDVEPGATVGEIPVTVSPGDRVTVELWQLSAGSWAISLTDNTNGQNYNTTQAYSGPGSSAEWLVEAPTVASTCGAGEDPSAPGICEIVPFSTINFGNLDVAGTIGTGTQFAIEQTGVTVQPTALSSTGFTLAYAS